MQTTDEINSRDKALQFLFGRIDYERALTIPHQADPLKLQRMQELLKRLGNPHENLNVVHVAGSKGKGSTAAMIASILSATGLRTGLYTSPHLERLEERISVNGAHCTASELIELVRRIRPEVEAMDRQIGVGSHYREGPTYFEITTALAFLYFSTRNVDIAVMEVGLGGRLDSTNVCRPIVSVITSISLDHTAQLGDTEAEIAGHKAGIIKSSVPVVSGVRRGAAREVIEARARQLACPVVTLGVDFDFRYVPPPHSQRRPSVGSSAPPYGQLDYWQTGNAGDIRWGGLHVGMLGRHQAANAAVALAVVNELRRQSWTITNAAVRRGLADASCPARIEVIQRNPLTIVDGAHNVASVQALIETIDEVFRGGRRIVIFATTQGKDARGMLRELMRRFDRILLTRYQKNPRSFDPQEMLTLVRQIGADMPALPEGQRVEICPDPERAWRKAYETATVHDLVCVTGSFFLAAELRCIIEKSCTTNQSTTSSSRRNREEAAG